MSEFIDIFFRSVFLENLALAYFLGMCTFLAVSKQIKTTLGLASAAQVSEVRFTAGAPGAPPAASSALSPERPPEPWRSC